MGLIGNHNIDHAKSFILTVALLPFGDDEVRCQTLKLTQIHDLNNFNWYVTNISTFKNLELDDKDTVYFVYKDGDELSLRTFIQSSKNDDLQRICTRIKTE